MTHEKRLCSWKELGTKGKTLRTGGQKKLVGKYMMVLEGWSIAQVAFQLFLKFFSRSQRSRGLSWSPSNYEELGWKRYFLMSEWDQNRTRASVAIDINARLYSVAIMYPLWLPHSHNMTDFCAFLTYFYHLSHTAVTVIIQTGPSRVPNLPHI